MTVRPTGTPIGIARGYHYREWITCDYFGSAASNHGAGAVTGWALPQYQCPANAKALNHWVEFGWL